MNYFEQMQQGALPPTPWDAWGLRAQPSYLPGGGTQEAVMPAPEGQFGQFNPMDYAANQYMGMRIPQGQPNIPPGVRGGPGALTPAPGPTQGAGIGWGDGPVTWQSQGLPGLPNYGNTQQNEAFMQYAPYANQFGQFG